MLLFPNYMNLVHAQSVGTNNPIKNVTALSNSFGNGTDIELQNSIYITLKMQMDILYFPWDRGTNPLNFPQSL